MTGWRILVSSQPCFSQLTLTPTRHARRISTIREDLLPGRHTLTCEVLEDTLDPKGGTEFRLISVLTD